MGIKSENKQILVATVISYITFAFNILVAIFYTPFLLNALGDADYGIRSFAISFVAYANILGTGIATAYLRFANIKKNEYGDEGVKDVDGVFYKIFILLGLISLAIGALLFTLFLTGTIPLKSYSKEQVFVVSTVILLSFITLGIKLPMSVSMLILNFKRKFVFRNTRYLLSAVFEYGFSFLCILLGFTVFKSQVIALSLISLISETVFGFITLIYLFLILRHHTNFKSKVVEKTIWKDIIKFSFLSLLIIAVMSLNDSTDRIILGFISPESVTFYSLTIIFNAYIKSVADSISVLYTPRITEEATLNKKDELQKSFEFVSKICVIIISFIVFGYVCCGKEFLVLWLGQSRENIYYYSLPLMIAMIFLYPHHFSIQIHRAYGKQKFAAFSLTATFLLNVAISIGLVVLLSKLTNNPALGCIIGTLFTYICESILLSVYNSKKLGIKQNKIWSQIFINILLGVFVAVFVNRFYELLNLSIRPVFVMIIKGFTYILIFGFIQFWMNKKDMFKLVKRKKNEAI